MWVSFRWLLSEDQGSPGQGKYKLGSFRVPITCHNPRCVLIYLKLDTNSSFQYCLPGSRQLPTTQARTILMLVRLLYPSRTRIKHLHTPLSTLKLSLTCTMSRRPISTSPAPQNDPQRAPKRQRLDHLTPESFRNGVFLAPMVRSGVCAY